MMSLMSMLSTWTPQPAATSSMISPMDWATSSRRPITSWRMRAPMTWRKVVWVRSTRAWRTLEMPKAALWGGDNVVVDDRGQAQGDVVL